MNKVNRVWVVGNGSTQGLTLTKEVVIDTDNLYKEFASENEVVESLVSKSKDSKPHFTGR